MKPRHSFLRIYLLLAIGFGLAGLMDSSLTAFSVETNIQAWLFLLLSLGFFLFNIIAIPIFHHHHVARIAYVLPLYHIISYLVLVGLSYLFFALKAGLESFGLVFIMAGFITSLFEILFSFYLLAKLRPA